MKKFYLLFFVLLATAVTSVMPVKIFNRENFKNLKELSKNLTVKTFNTTKNTATATTKIFSGAINEIVSNEYTLPIAVLLTVFNEQFGETGIKICLKIIKVFGVAAAVKIIATNPKMANVLRKIKEGYQNYKNPVENSIAIQTE